MQHKLSERQRFSNRSNTGSLSDQIGLHQMHGGVEQDEGQQIIDPGACDPDVIRQRQIGLHAPIAAGQSVKQRQADPGNSMFYPARFITKEHITGNAQGQEVLMN